MQTDCKISLQILQRKGAGFHNVSESEVEELLAVVLTNLYWGTLEQLRAKEEKTARMMTQGRL